MSGLFVTLEGGEGAGKSTAAAGLARLLRADGRETVTTREPGGTAGAEAIRALLLSNDITLDPLAQTLLHFAARADHVAGLIRPALARGAVVICDRYSDSTLAYQAYGQGVAAAKVRQLSALIGLTPDLTFILQIPESVSKERLRKRGLAEDRYERMGPDFMARVAAGFAAIAAAEPGRCVLIDGTERPEIVAARLYEAVKARLGA